MNKCVTLVPVYKSRLTKNEELTLKFSIFELKLKNIVFIGPEKFDYSYYQENFKHITIEKFSNEYFESVQGYSKLMLNLDFYNLFSSSTFMLLYQTDALIIRNDIESWCNQDFDYIGAPWPDKFQYLMQFDNFQNNPINVSASVGNGGLSLRRIQKCRELINEFPELHSFFINTGSSEDLFFGIGSNISRNFRTPNEITASLFSLELQPEKYYQINGKSISMGAHAWEKYNPKFWYSICPFLSL